MNLTMTQPAEGVMSSKTPAQYRKGYREGVEAAWQYLEGEARRLRTQSREWLSEGEECMGNGMARLADRVQGMADHVAAMAVQEDQGGR